MALLFGDTFSWLCGLLEGLELVVGSRNILDLAFLDLGL